MMKRYRNPSARHYRIEERIEAGIVLSGQETKAVKTRGIQLNQATVQFNQGEAYLVNAVIAPYQFARSEDYNPSRSRKLLLRKSQLAWLLKRKKAKLTIIPLACYNKAGWIKVLLGIGKRKKKIDKKRELIKKEEEKRVKKIMGMN